MSCKEKPKTAGEFYRMLKEESAILRLIKVFFFLNQMEVKKMPPSFSETKTSQERKLCVSMCGCKHEYICVHMCVRSENSLG